VSLLVPPGAPLLAVLGLAVSAGQLTSGWDLWRRLSRSLPATDDRVRPTILRAVIASVIAVAPVYLATQAVGVPNHGHARLLVETFAAVALALVLYVGVQRLWRSPELAALVKSRR
jgi:hypothetical protein